MKARRNILSGIVVLGIIINCSTLNDDHPQIMTEKCDICHSLPPQDSGNVWKEDPTVNVGIHFQHVTSESLTCNRCHRNYDTATGWNILSDHRTDTIRYDTSRCVLCHEYSNCNNSECHNSPPTSPPMVRRHHAAHVGRMGYKCHVCHKGFDLEQKIIPEDLHDNGNKDVNFDLRLENGITLPNDPLGPPYFDGTTLTCNLVYCHGSTIVGGKKTISVSDKIDTVGGARCNACHDTLLLAQTVDHSRPGTADRKGHADHFKDGCLNCHKNYSLDVGLVNKTLHINGKKDLADCDKCHTDGIPLPFANINGVITRVK